MGQFFRMMLVVGVLVALATSKLHAQWEYIRLDSPPYSSALSFINADTGFSASFTVLWKTTDGAKTWASIPITGLSSLYRIQFTSDSVGWARGSYEMSRTSDGGSTWTMFEPYENDLPPDWKPSFLEAINDSVAFIGGNYYTLWRTTNGGKRWIRVYYQSDPRYTNYPLKDIYFVDTLRGFATAGNRAHQTIRTTDGGLTWTGIATAGDTSHVYSETPIKLHFFDPMNGVQALINSFAVTTDGGRSWSTRAALTGTKILDMVFADSARGYIVSDDSIGRLLETDDQGYTWRSTYLDPISFESKLHFPTADRGYINGREVRNGIVSSVLRYDRATADVDHIGRVEDEDPRTGLIELRDRSVILTGFEPGSTITIADLLGRQVLSGAVDKFETPIDLREIPSGAYIIFVTSGETRVTRKVIVGSR